MRDAEAFWVTGKGRGEIRSAPLRAPGPGEVVVQTHWSAVSRGTESLVFAGAVPTSEHARMRAPHQDGAFTFPVKYGYACVGEVIAGAGVGRTVFSLFPHQTAFCVPASAVADVPSAVPPARAVLAANLETAITAAWDANVSVGDRVVVVGAGALGCLTARVCASIAGCEVQLVDIDPRRRTVAHSLGAAFAEPGDAWEGADVVIHASASAEGLARCFASAGPEATIVELSWYGDRQIPVGLGGAFHPQRLRLVSSQVGTIPPRLAPRWTHRRRLELALRLLEDDAFDHIITDESPFATLPRVLADLADPTNPTLCHRIQYPPCTPSASVTT